MQKLEAVRDRARGSGNWLRLGVVFTTTMAPIIARWNDLRTTKRTLRQREETAARLTSPRAASLTGLRTRVMGRRAISNHNHHDQHDQLLVSLPLTDASQPSKTRMRSDNVRVGLWAAGVGIGLVAAGAGAYFLARRRMDASAEEPLLELPANGPRGGGSSSTGRNPSARDMTPPANRSGATITTDRGAAPTIPDAAGGFGPADVVEPGMPGPAARRERSAPPPEDAKFVGNMHTMIYHDATDLAHLPAEDNRVYFHNEDEAREAGYRRDRREAPPPPEAGLTTEGPTA